jgi:uncharacterized protein (DUF2164 family)
MYWRFYSLVGLVFILASVHVLADERLQTPFVTTVDSAAPTAAVSLLMPAQDFLFFSVHKSPRERSQHGSEEQKGLATPITTYTLLRRSAPRSLVLPTFVQDLLGPWLPQLPRPDPPRLFSEKAASNLELSPWPVKPSPQPPRVDHVWRVVPVETVAQTLDHPTLDGDVDLGLEVRAGTGKRDRATNAIKGTASSRFTLLPTRFFGQRFGHYLNIMGRNDEVAQATLEQLRLGVVTNGAYALNPSTKVITPTGAVVGSLSWMPPVRDRYAHDPWRVVAFRWYPTVSIEGRSHMGEEKKRAVINRLPLDTLIGSLRGELRLDFLSPHLAASGNYQYQQRLTDAQTKWEQASLSLKYQLNHQVTLGSSFTHGKKAPHQPIERGLALEMGVTF